MSAVATRRVTLNEIARLSRRVLVSLRVGPGADREPGEAVAWLESRGLAGVETLCADLDALRLQGAAVRAMHAREARTGACLELDAAGASALLLAPAALDWVLAQAPGARARIRDARSPAWALPALAGAQGPSWALAQDAAGGPVLRASAGGDGARLDLWRPVAALPGLAACLQIGTGAPPEAAGEPLEALAGDALEVRHRRSLACGRRVEAGCWERLLEVARESLVPESETSRARGAGGGDDNA